MERDGKRANGKTRKRSKQPGAQRSSQLRDGKDSVRTTKAKERKAKQGIQKNSKLRAGRPNDLIKKFDNMARVQSSCSRSGTFR